MQITIRFERLLWRTCFFGLLCVCPLPLALAQSPNLAATVEDYAARADAYEKARIDYANKNTRPRKSPGIVQRCRIALSNFRSLRALNASRPASGTNSEGQRHIARRATIADSFRHVVNFRPENEFDALFLWRVQAKFLSKVRELLTAADEIANYFVAVERFNRQVDVSEAIQYNALRPQIERYFQILDQLTRVPLKKLSNLPTVADINLAYFTREQWLLAHRHETAKLDERSQTDYEALMLEYDARIAYLEGRGRTQDYFERFKFNVGDKIVLSPRGEQYNWHGTFMGYDPEGNLLFRWEQETEVRAFGLEHLNVFESIKLNETQ